MDSRRQHHGTQQFPPLLQTQGSGHPPRQHLPLPPPHLAMGGPRPSPFSGGPAPPISGHKRSSTALYNRSADGPNFAKVFVGSLPRNISEEKVRELFSDFGNVVEVILLKDKKTGLPQGCCFVKFSSVVEAERAIRALDNQLNLQGASEPLQVKFADGDRDHPGLHEHKLFVGSVSRQANEQDIEEIFAPYGRVENVYVIRNEHKQSRGCAFVSFPEREMAIAAISALDGVYRMAGCHQPLIVRFADPKRPRSGEARMGNTGTNYSPHSHQGAGAPRGSGGQSFRGQSPAYGWRQGGGSGGMGLLPQTGILPLGGRVARGGPLEGSNATVDGRAGVGGVPASPIMSGQLAFSGTSPQLSQPQGANESSLQRPVQAFGHQLPLHQQALQPNLSSIPHHNQMQPVQGIPLTQPTDKRVQQLVSSGQFSPAQQTAQAYGPPSVSHHQSQPQVVTSMQQGLPTQQLPWQPLHQQISQPIQQQPIMMPLQQGHQQILPLQFLPSQPQQQVIVKEQPLPSQLQQQVVVKETVQQAYLQPPQMTSQQPVAGNVQPSWSVPVQQHVITPQAAPAVAVAVTPAPALVTCDWTEHTSPEGHKYYYNSSTGESRWEKPEEFSASEKQKLMQQQQQQHQQLQQQQPHLHQQQEVQAQVQPHVQQLQPQMLNQQYQQQQQLANQQPQQALQQPYAQNVQPYQQQHQAHMQQVPQHHLQLQQPQLQQLQQQQQPQQQPSAQHHQAPLLQQPQRETQLPSAGVPSVHYGQSTSGGSYQPVEGYGHMQPQMHQQLPPSRQAPSANGTPGAQWIPAAQQAVPNQEWMWKSKPMGS